MCKKKDREHEQQVECEKLNVENLYYHYYF